MAASVFRVLPKTSQTHDSTCTRRQNVPVHSNVRAVSKDMLQADDIARPALLLMRGWRRRESSAGDVVQQ